MRGYASARLSAVDINTRIIDALICINALVAADFAARKVTDLGPSRAERDQHAPSRRKILASHSSPRLLAQNPRLLQYEEFFHLYAAMDAAYALMKRLGIVGNARHFEKVGVMCDALGITTPIWAKDPSGDSEVAALRNPTFHEALFSGEPLGFAVYRGASALGQNVNVLLEMEALMCRFIVALLGRPQSYYVKSPITTRQMHGLDLR